MTAYNLDETTLEAIRTARHNRESGWRIIARLFAAEMDAEIGRAAVAGRKPAPKMLIYQAVAYAAGYTVPAVRAWTRYEAWAGDLLDETQPTGETRITIAHLRLAEREAKQRKEKPDETLLRRINAADKRSGAVIAPDAWAAELKPQKDDGVTPLVAALARCKRNLDAASRNAATALSESAKIKRGAGVAERLNADIKDALETVDAMIDNPE